MNSHAEKSLWRIAVVLFFVLAANFAHSQERTATLSGTVADFAGKPAANVKISARNVDTGNVTEARTDSSGHELDSSGA
jgi:hypothetical protein